MNFLKLKTSVTEIQSLTNNTIVSALRSVLNDVKNDEVFRQSFLHNSTLSKAKFLQELKARVSSNVPAKFFRDPECYPLVREIRFLVEGVKYSCDEVSIRYASIIQQVKDSSLGTTAELSNKNRKLYKSVMKTGHSKIIWFLSEFGEKPHYFYLSDEELVKQCGEFSSFTELKNKGKGDLHLHIKGRRLEQQVVCAHPKYLTHVYVGINNKSYRSLGELTVGNMCEFNNEYYKFESNYRIKREGSDKNMESDFLFYDSLNQPVYLEVVQNTDSNRGSRREQYAARHQGKLDALMRQNIVPVCVTIDNYSDHGSFDFVKFAHEVKLRLAERGVLLKEVPAKKVLSMQNSEYAKFLIESDMNVLLEHLFNELNVSSMAVWDNKFSTVKNVLEARPDNCLSEIRTMLLAKSSKITSEKIRLKWKTRRDKFMPFSKLKEIVRKKKIQSQSQWYEFARSNKDFLRKNSIPCDVSNVYTHRGEWISWPDFYRQG